MKILPSGKKSWTNRHETFTEPIQDLFTLGNEPGMNALDAYNEATKSLQHLLAGAVSSNTGLRSMGAGWSWSKIGTTADGILLDTKPLNSTLTLKTDSVVPEYTGDVTKLLFAQCGNAVWELSAVLRNAGLSLKTSGASNGQTIVGAMSTGAHGSSVDVGAIPEYVVGMHLITGPASHVWLERKSYPVVSASLVNTLGTHLIQDDDLFNAALVSFGSFGIIHGVLLETESVFLLEGYMERMPYDDTLKMLMETLDFNHAQLPCGNERPFHFEVKINPYDLGRGAYVTTFYKRSYTDVYSKPTPNDAGLGPGDDAPCFIGKLTDCIPDLVPAVVNTLLGNALQPFSKKTGTLAEIFSNTTLHGKLYSAALGLPVEYITRVTALLLELNKTAGPFPGLFAYRFIRKSTALLGFTRYRYTCILEMDGTFANTTLNFYRAVWHKLEEENIPYTMHWGKINELNYDRIYTMYGENVVKWIDARNTLLDRESMPIFTNPLLRQWGLDTVHKPF
jgi:hypothetical protein